MPTWLVPVLKAVLPHLGTVLSAAAPVFTKKGAEVVAVQTHVLQQQVAELQAAVSKNDEHIKELAKQIRTTLGAMEEGAAVAERRYQRMFAVSLAAGVIALVTFLLVLTLLVR